MSARMRPVVPGVLWGQNGDMSEQFAWVSDVSRGEWLRAMENEPFGSVLSIVPPGYEAYARIFHPATRDRPRAEGSWEGLDQEEYFTGTRDIEASLEIQSATWSQVAASFGTTMHAGAQYPRLMRSEDRDVDGEIGPDGWRYSGAHEGSIDANSLATASAVLARHTSTPDAGIAAIWEGWGGLVSSAGYARFFGWELSGSPLRDGLLKARLAAARWVRGIAASLPPRQPAPGTGLLSREAAAGPRFGLHADTGRSYVLFEVGANDLADAAWTQRAPWIDDYRLAQSPSILWPDDHAWLLATEIDFDSTLIAGSTALIREFVQAHGIEALPLRPDANLSWDGDDVNRP